MKPKLFIGSSTEGIDLAFAVQENLEHNIEPTVWTQGVFKPSQGTLESLSESVKLFDFAAFVFLPDDTATIRKSEVTVIRDNVIFELGLFIGRLGRSRCFFIVPRGEENLHLPTDLIGVTPLDFDAHRSDGNLTAALGPACNQMRKVIVAKGSIQQPDEEAKSCVITANAQDKDAKSKKRLLRSVAQLYQNMEESARTNAHGGAGGPLSRIYKDLISDAQTLYPDLGLSNLDSVSHVTQNREFLSLTGQLKSILETEETDPL